MTLLQNEVESIHRAKNATNAIRDDAAYAEVESAIEDLIKVIGRVQGRLIKSNKHIKRLIEAGERLSNEGPTGRNVLAWELAKDLE